MKINTQNWLETQIQKTIKELEAKKDDEDLLVLLDKYISMKKKYSSNVDHLGEKIRVMENFAIFVKNKFPEYRLLIKNMIKKFLA